MGWLHSVGAEMMRSVDIAAQSAAGDTGSQQKKSGKFRETGKSSQHDKTAKQGIQMKMGNTVFCRLVLTVGLLLCSGWSMADWPASVMAKYEGKVNARGMNITGTGEWAWNNSKTAYSTTLKLKAFFSTLRSQSSQGVLGSRQVMQPVSFVDEKRDADTTVFDYSTNQLTLHNRTQLPIKAGTLDRLNVLIRLGVDVQTNPQVGRVLSYTVAGGNKVQPWQFTIESRKNLTLKLNGKEQQTVAYRVLKHEKDKKLIGFWYAPDVHVLPVRIELEKPNGDRGLFDMVSLKPTEDRAE